MENAHLKKGLADDCFQTFQVFIFLNFAPIEVVSMYTILALVE